MPVKSAWLASITIFLNSTWPLAEIEHGMFYDTYLKYKKKVGGPKNLYVRVEVGVAKKVQNCVQVHSSYKWIITLEKWGRLKVR